MLPFGVQAQDVDTAAMSVSEVDALPPEYRTGPVVTDVTETSVDADGVETITRIRRIETTSPRYGSHAHQAHAETYAFRKLPAHGYAPAASVFERDQWISECERRTNGRDNREKGGIIGGLLGAIAGALRSASDYRQNFACIRLF